MAELPNIPGAPPLALRPKLAAQALGIGQRKLWELTHPRGPAGMGRGPYDQRAKHTHPLSRFALGHAVFLALAIGRRLLGD